MFRRKIVDIGKYTYAMVEGFIVRPESCTSRKILRICASSNETAGIDVGVKAEFSKSGTHSSFS